MNSRSVIVAYSGVHAAFQIALAAEEAGLLEAFYGSIFDTPGKWGKWMGLVLGANVLASRRCPGLDPSRLKEIPLPFLLHRAAGVTRRTRGWYAWDRANFDFDRKAAAHLQQSHARIFIGTETCARDSFQAATKRGMVKILDCPQVHPVFLTTLLAEAADRLELPPPPAFDSAEMAARKVEEFAMADVMLVISEVQCQSFIAAKFSKDKLVEIPLWVDSEFWYPAEKQKDKSSQSALKVLFVGSIGLRKGIPYLLKAIEKINPLAGLTFVGANSGETDSFLAKTSAKINLAGTKNKIELRKMYWDADILVLPSLVDTFGFVALEAMACGLPVIVTENCGVPVPDPAWRVPIMDSDAIAKRLEFYAKDREALQRDGQIAAEFARQFTPERYRGQIKNLLRTLLK